MRIIFLGPPGSGKGTQTQILAQKIGAPQISSGDLLREAVKNNTPTGKKAKGYMDRGELVPDSIVIQLMGERIEDEHVFILDGFPRTIPQAEELAESGVEIDKVVSFTANDDMIIKRLSGRRTCRECGAIFHLEYMPPKEEGKCDKCSGELFQRDDDKEESIKNRLVVYGKQTAPLIDFYKNKGNLVVINGENAPEEVLRDTLNVLS